MTGDSDHRRYTLECIADTRQGAGGPKANACPKSLLWYNVCNTRLRTVIGLANGLTIATVEHLLAALRGLGVDNALVELCGPEIPAFDGSARRFVEALDAAGIHSLAAPRRFIRIVRPVAFRCGEAWCELSPANHFELDVTIDFPDREIGRQRFCEIITPDTFRSELAAARTFGRRADLAAIQADGLGLGASTDTAIAIGPRGVENPEGLRWRDEFVRHKALDAVGDLALAGLPLLGKYRSCCAGHRHTNGLLRKLFSDDEGTRAFQIIAAPQQAPSHDTVPVPLPARSRIAAAGGQ